MEYLSTGICPKILIWKPLRRLYQELYVIFLVPFSYRLFRYFQGTWAFLSLRLSKRPKKDQDQLVHGRVDDLESFYHVLFWVSLQYARHGLNPVNLYDDLNRLFDHALIDGDKVFSNCSKDSHMTSTRTIDTATFQSFPLRELLLKLSATFKVLYIDPPNTNIISPRNRKTQRTRELY